MLRCNISEPRAAETFLETFKLPFQPNSSRILKFNPIFFPEENSSKIPEIEVF